MWRNVVDVLVPHEGAEHLSRAHRDRPNSTHVGNAATAEMSS
jgi:hypothetical protein